jgi:hypothetical protein
LQAMHPRRFDGGSSMLEWNVSRSNRGGGDVHQYRFAGPWHPTAIQA